MRVCMTVRPFLLEVRETNIYFLLTTIDYTRHTSAVLQERGIYEMKMKKKHSGERLGQTKK